MPLWLATTGRVIRIPFNLFEFREIKQDPGNFTYDSEKYISSFRKLCALYDLTRRDVKIICDEDPSFHREKKEVLDQAVQVDNAYYLIHSKRHPHIPTRHTTVPEAEPDWDPENPF